MKLRILLLSMLVATMAACGDKQSQDVKTGALAEKTVEIEPVGLKRTPSVEGARVFFITPSDGATLSGPVSIEFGIEGMAVVKAGNMQPQSGHHHLLIDTGLPNLDLPIPADANHIHFGDGSTSTELTLDPGQHSLQLLLGDHLHIPHQPPVVSEVITITVE